MRRPTRAGTIEHLSNIACGGLQAAALAHRAELVRFLRARGVSADDAEDILQDLYLKVCMLRIAPVAEPRAYLYRMTANLAFDRRRMAARRSARELQWAEAGPSPTEQIDEQPSVEQELVAREELANVSRALGSLPERTVAILRRYRIDGETQKEIAFQLGISLSAVEKHLQKAYRAVFEAQARLDADQALPRSSEAEG